MLLYTRGARELAEYYSRPAPGVEEIGREIRECCEAHGDESPCTKKSLIHEIIAGKCSLALFPHFPFFWEVSVGRNRRDWGCSSPLSSYLKETSVDRWLGAYQRDVRKYIDAALFRGWSPVGYDHHCPGYDLIFEKGLLGLIARARERMALVDGRASAEARAERDFLEAVIRSNGALIGLANRFAGEAEHLLAGDQDEEGRINLRRIAAAARRVPANPPETFYEAIAVILFIRETYGSLEAFAQSTFGQIDRLLYPYYEKDLRAGRITREEAFALIHALLAFTDAKFGINDTFFSETSTTVVIGGCDRRGTVVFNEVTRMVVQACIENRYIGTKIIARISGGHPEEYFSLLAEFTASRANILVMPNDDVLIPANRRWNKAAGDARLYVGGGCHEMVLANTEVNTRADSWVNLPGLFLRTLAPQSDTPDLPEFKSGADSPDFETFYAACMDNVQRFHNIITAAKEKYEKQWNCFDAAPLYSASILDCIENARDVTAGGARYNSISLSMVGAATFIDSLYVVKRIVYDEKRINLGELWNVLSDDWRGQETLRLYIINRLPRYGTGNPEMDGFADRVLRDLSKKAGQPNGRGGVVSPAFYPHDTFIGFGLGTQATPDGRRRGAYLSRGIAPSEFTGVRSVTDIVRSLNVFDLTLFPESMATEITLPLSVSSRHGIDSVAALIKTFAQSGGSTLQINVLDRETLIRAREEPEKYPNVVVRICGYSQAFNSLSDQQKDEVISRTARAV
jgi:formate C-acetyltransferase